MFPPQFIVAERIGTGLDVQSKKRLLEVLAEYLATALPNVAPEEVFGRLRERERFGSTGIGHGIALPHARLRAATQPIGAFVQLAQALDFDAIDGKPVDLAFALVVPESATETHLQLLGQLAELFDNPERREKLRAASDPGEILRHLQPG